MPLFVSVPVPTLMSPEPLMVPLLVTLRPPVTTDAPVASRSSVPVFAKDPLEPSVNVPLLAMFSVPVLVQRPELWVTGPDTVTPPTVAAGVKAIEPPVKVIGLALLN